jgi:anti-sigma factor RsiW
MRCHEARALDTAYLDSELDSRTSLEIDQHLADCAGCRRYFDVQQKLDVRIDAVLRGGTRDPQLWCQIEAQISENSSPALVKHRWRRAPAFAIAASVALAITWVAWPRPLPNPLVAAVAVDHLKYLNGSMPPQFEEEPSSEALARTDGRLDRSAFFKLPASAKFTPEGKRLCKIEGVPIAWMMGSSAGTPISVVVMKQSEITSFPALRKRFEDGHRIACFKAGDFEFGARVVDGHVVCVVGDLPRSEIESLLASVEAR